jgi:hypothetical protein
MAAEEISLNDSKVVTLRELLRPGLKAVFIGLNPALTSVSLGHYWQGQHGRMRWNLLHRCDLTPSLPHGVEDDAAFAFGYGFADLIRRPTRSSKELTKSELLAAPSNLAIRLGVTGDHPPIVFIYKDAWKFAGPTLAGLGYPTLRMPGPYEKRARVELMMRDIRLALGLG